MLEISLSLVILIAVIAFLCEYVDSSLGMGYGTAMTPLLLLFGFSPLQIVPAILLSELVTGFLAGMLHHRVGNVNFKPRTTKISIIKRKLRSLGLIKSIRKGFPLHLKVVVALVSCSVIGAMVAVFVGLIIPKLWLKLYIGILVILMGIIIITFLGKKFKFSWLKIMSLGLIASFNKGLTGGGYGPLIVSGQILSGVEGKSAVGITSLAESLTCFIGVITYIVATKNTVDWRLAPIIITGAICSVPFSAKSVKKINTQKLTLTIGIVTILLGLFTTIRTLKGG